MLTYDAALRLFEAGEFGTLAKAWAQVTPTTPQSVRVLVAHALARVGDAPRALEWVAGAPDRPSSPLLKARASIVTGLALRAQGSSTEASKHLNAAVRLAQEAEDAFELAWTRLHLLRHTVDGIGAKDFEAMVPAVREAVNRAGRPQPIAYLHLIVAAMEGQNGRYDEARRHCEAAESLLQLAPHAWLQCTSLANRSALAMVA